MPDHTGSLEESFEDFFENTVCGFATTTSQGIIIRANKTLSDFVGSSPADLKGRKFQDLLSISGKIYYETHLWPLLRMQGFFQEVAVELTARGETKLPVFINAMERRDENKQPLLIRFTVLKATDRRQYEDNLKQSKAALELSLANAVQLATLRDQLIAILGHDLRNPLGSVIMGSSYLAENDLTPDQLHIVNIMQRSSARMNELIGNIMDFARTRLGQGLVIDPKPTDMKSILEHVAEELRTGWPSREIVTEISLPDPVVCDGPRIAQLASNLLANALIHGAKNTPVKLRSAVSGGKFLLEVINNGAPIPAAIVDKLFEPFTRETDRPSQNGLGLGLYIASQITKAHGGTIMVDSNSVQTRFTFIMPTSDSPMPEAN